MGERLKPKTEVLQPDFDLEQAIRTVAEKGYFFGHGAMTEDACQALADEVAQLELEEGDHVRMPINPGTPREVKQLHERYYCSIWDPQVPTALAVTKEVASKVQRLSSIDLSLCGWFPNEVGYQRYRSTDDWISPHRDRRNDQILAFTITINGEADVLIHEPVDDPDDYANLRVVDQFRTSPGSVMFLRAPGLGSGEQIIHEVRPPDEGSRLILNLRMRPDILLPPSSFAKP